MNNDYKHTVQKLQMALKSRKRYPCSVMIRDILTTQRYRFSSIRSIKIEIDSISHLSCLCWFSYSHPHKAGKACSTRPPLWWFCEYCASLSLHREKPHKLIKSGSSSALQGLRAMEH